jgi:heterodisulfide reductase subunit C
MAALKRMAVAEGLLIDKKSPVFYRTFMDTVRRYGRVREMELMTRYFIALGNPAVPVGFTPLGVKLFIKGKISLQMPSLFSEGKLDPIYRKVREMEANS